MKNRSALTLIEVVASLSLLAAAVTALLVIQSRLLSDWSELKDRMAASTLAEALMAEWRLEPQAAREARQGVFEHDSHRSWTRYARPWPGAGALAIEEVTLTVSSRSDRLGVREYTWTWLEHDDAP